MKRQNSPWIESRINHYWLAISRIRGRMWIYRITIMPGDLWGKCCHDLWRILYLFLSNASDQPSFAHGASIASDAGRAARLIVLVWISVLLLFSSSPKDEKHTANNGCQTKDTSDSAPSNNAYVRSTVRAPSFSWSHRGRDKECSGDNGAAFGKDPYAGLRVCGICFESCCRFGVLHFGSAASLYIRAEGSMKRWVELHEWMKEK